MSPALPAPRTTTLRTILVEMAIHFGSTRRAVMLAGRAERNSQEIGDDRTGRKCVGESGRTAFQRIKRYDVFRGAGAASGGRGLGRKSAGDREDDGSLLVLDIHHVDDE